MSCLASAWSSVARRCALAPLRRREARADERGAGDLRAHHRVEPLGRSGSAAAQVRRRRRRATTSISSACSARGPTCSPASTTTRAGSTPRPPPRRSSRGARRSSRRSTQIAADVAQARERARGDGRLRRLRGARQRRGRRGVHHARGHADHRAPTSRGIVARIPATRIHVIADACASYFLAYGRGPGGERRPLERFQDSPQLASDPRVGLLLSTSSARESHEWEGVPGGRLQPRGPLGSLRRRRRRRRRAGELPRDRGVRRAAPTPPSRTSASARTSTRGRPGRSDTLVDLRRGLERRLDIDGAHAAHYVDGRRARRAPARLPQRRPGSRSTSCARRRRRASTSAALDDDTEFAFPLARSVISLADLEASAAARGRARRRARGLQPHSSRCRSTATSSIRTCRALRSQRS